MGSITRRLLAVTLIFSLILGIGACRNRGVERPAGYLRLGPARELMNPETYFPKERLLLRYDERGFYVMSTASTFDGTALVKKNWDNTTIWASAFSTTTYDAAGKLLNGPGEADLPYYYLTLDAGSYTGKKDTLYVYIGDYVSPDWRMPLPPDLGGANSTPTSP